LQGGNLKLSEITNSQLLISFLRMIFLRGSQDQTLGNLTLRRKLIDSSEKLVGHAAEFNTESNVA